MQSGHPIVSIGCPQERGQRCGQRACRCAQGVRDMLLCDHHVFPCCG